MVLDVPIRCLSTDTVFSQVFFGFQNERGTHFCLSPRPLPSTFPCHLNLYLPIMSPITIYISSIMCASIHLACYESFRPGFMFHEMLFLNYPIPMRNSTQLQLSDYFYIWPLLTIINITMLFNCVSDTHSYPWMLICNNIRVCILVLINYNVRTCNYHAVWCNHRKPFITSFTEANCWVTCTCFMQEYCCLIIAQNVEYGGNVCKI